MHEPRLDKLIRNVERAAISYNGYPIPESKDALKKARKKLKRYVQWHRSFPTA